MVCVLSFSDRRVSCQGKLESNIEYEEAIYHVMARGSRLGRSCVARPISMPYVMSLGAEELQKTPDAVTRRALG